MGAAVAAALEAVLRAQARDGYGGKEERGEGVDDDEGEEYEGCGNGGGGREALAALRGDRQTVKNSSSGRNGIYITLN